MTNTARRQTLNPVLEEKDGKALYARTILPVTLKEETRRDFWDKISVTDTTAIMSKAVYAELPVYKNRPDTVRIGQRWKIYAAPVWYMCEFVKAPSGTGPIIKYRKIVIEGDHLPLFQGECTSVCTECQAKVRVPNMPGCRPWIRHRPGCSLTYKSVQEAIR